MTRSPLQHEFSRRTLLRSGLALGAGLSLGSLVGCATPTGAPGPRTAGLALNRSLVSLDNKLNQFDAALTVQRAVRQSLITLDQHLKPQLVLADRFELTNPRQWYVHLRPGIIYSDGRPVQVQDVATALKMYSEVSGSFVGGFFPEWPTVDQIDESSFTLNTVRPVPVLDYLMTNILITPAADNRPEELQSGVGSGPYIVTASNRGTGNYTLEKNAKYWGPAPHIESVDVRFVPDESNRVVSLRSGIVLARKGGLLKTLRPIVWLGLAGRQGSGRQFQPWIALTDEVAAIRFLLDSDLSGPVNLAAPKPARNAELMSAIAKAMHRPALLPVPEFVLRPVLRELAPGLLGGQRALPVRLTEAGFRFRYPELDAALHATLG